MGFLRMMIRKGTEKKIYITAIRAFKSMVSETYLKLIISKINNMKCEIALPNEMKPVYEVTPNNNLSDEQKAEGQALRTTAGRKKLTIVEKNIT